MDRYSGVVGARPWATDDKMRAEHLSKMDRVGSKSRIRCLASCRPFFDFQGEVIPNAFQELKLGWRDRTAFLNRMFRYHTLVFTLLQIFDFKSKVDFSEATPVSDAEGTTTSVLTYLPLTHIAMHVLRLQEPPITASNLMTHSPSLQGASDCLLVVTGLVMSIRAYLSSEYE